MSAALETRQHLVNNFLFELYISAENTNIMPTAMYLFINKNVESVTLDLSKMYKKCVVYFIK